MFYSGSPLRMSFDEADGAKSVNVVTFGAVGAVPEVRRVEVPQMVTILNLEGTPEVVRARLCELVAEVGTLRYVRIMLKGFDGEAREHWESFRQLAKDTDVRILDEIDMRPAMAATAGLKAFGGKSLRNVSPHDLAEQKLRTSGRHFSDGQVAECLRLFDQVAAEVNGAVA